MRAYRMTILIVDHDDIGPDEAKATIEQQRFPNHCIAPVVLRVDEAEIGRWSDTHPLNTVQDRLERLDWFEHFRTKCEAAHPPMWSVWRHHRRQTLYQVVGTIRVRLSESDGWRDVVQYVSTQTGDSFAQPARLFRSKMKRAVRFVIDGVTHTDNRGSE